MSKSKSAPNSAGGEAVEVIGIDLGTTHTALAHVSSSAEGDAARPAVFSVTQLVAQGAAEARSLLPSFLYFAHESEGKLAVPWDEARTYAVGEYARARGSDAPARTVSSAKSWLCHPTLDRRGAHLPVNAPADVAKISPVDASFRYVEHLAEAYSHTAGRRLGDQDVVLTVPASFDPAARELTVEAAKRAGLEKLTLLEEPQAALYAWIDGRGEAWRKEIKVGEVILVVDVGGGTTDFSAICALEREGSLELVRVAVGDHILLGGDNMDLTLAHVVRAKIEASGKELDAWQMAALTHAARSAKEKLLSHGDETAVPIVVPSRGSKLMGGSLRSELTREEVRTTLVEGFFPVVAASARPAVRARAALTQLGLAYASDPGITRHLAAFLGRQADALEKLEGYSLPPGTKTGALLRPTAILFNGGVMKSELLRGRLTETLNAWLTADGAPPARTLEGADYDLAVARGAAVYGLARRGKGFRIRGGTARAYYVGIEGAVPAVPGMEPPITALCVAPFGMEEGTEAKLPEEELGVVVGEKVQFRFFGSTTRRDDVPGSALERWKQGELEELAPIEVTLPTAGRREGDVVPVHLRASVSAIGTLELEAIPTKALTDGERWKVELSVRSD